MKRGTPEHPKTVRLSRILDIERWGAIGLLEGLWHFAARYAIQGDIGRWSNQEIADGIGWHGRHGTPDALVAALVEARFLDESPEHRLLIHDWADHCDESVRKTLKSRGLSVLVRDDSRKVEKGSEDSGRVGPAFPFLSSPSLSSPSPSSPSLAVAEEGEEGFGGDNGKTTTDLIAVLRQQPFGLTESDRAVRTALANGCSPQQIMAVAEHWKAKLPAWNSGQLCRRIEKAMPTDDPAGAWPKPNVRSARRPVGTGDQETDRINEEFKARQAAKGAAK